MTTELIRINTEVFNKLNEMKVDPRNYHDDRERRSFTTIISKLLHDSQELRRIEQSAMSEGEDSLKPETPLKSPIKSKQNALKKSVNSSHLFCYDCQELTPHRQLKNKRWKCGICGSVRDV